MSIILNILNRLFLIFKSMSKRFDFNINVKDLNGANGAPSPKYDARQLSTVSGISGVTGS